MGFVFKDRWALVTGASSGIGKELAEELAHRGTNLVVVARRENLLTDLATNLEKKYGVKVVVHAMDLTAPDAAVALTEFLKEYEVSILVNNAGFAATGPVLDTEWATYRRMLDLNMGFLCELTYRMLPDLKRRDQARILNVGSIAGYQGVSNMVIYSATKAFVNNFTEGLQWELHGSNVAATCLQPGKTESEFFDVAHMRGTRFVKSGVMSARAVARQGIDAMQKGKPSLVTGWMNKISIFGLRLSPRWLVGFTIRNMFREMGR